MNQRREPVHVWSENSPKYICNWNVQIGISLENELNQIKSTEYERNQEYFRNRSKQHFCVVFIDIVVVVVATARATAAARSVHITFNLGKWFNQTSNN